MMNISLMTVTSLWKIMTSQRFLQSGKYCVITLRQLIPKRKLEKISVLHLTVQRFVLPSLPLLTDSTIEESNVGFTFLSS